MLLQSQLLFALNIHPHLLHHVRRAVAMGGREVFLQVYPGDEVEVGSVIV